jgi:membrane-associated HD superfamily phosphohydrolase
MQKNENYKTFNLLIFTRVHAVQQFCYFLWILKVFILLIDIIICFCLVWKSAKYNNNRENKLFASLKSYFNLMIYW